MASVLTAPAVTQSPWAWHPHTLAWVAILATVLAWRWLPRHFASWCPTAPRLVTRRQVGGFSAGIVLLAIALTWPVADVANRSLLFHMVQQTLLLLAIPPLLMLGTPRWLIEVITRPRLVDAVSRFLARPLVSTVIFNSLVVVSFTTPVVNASARSDLAHAALNVTLLLTGAVMWLPALRILPGVGHLGRTGRAAYLIVQAVVPSFASLVFIFARHPLYEVFRHRSLGLDPLIDQQLAGAFAKVVGLIVLTGAAWAMMARSTQLEQADVDPDPLMWDDVERELRRLERRPKRDDPAA